MAHGEIGRKKDELCSRLLSKLFDGIYLNEIDIWIRSKFVGGEHITRDLRKYTKTDFYNSLLEIYRNRARQQRHEFGEMFSEKHYCIELLKNLNDTLNKTYYKNTDVVDEFGEFEQIRLFNSEQLNALKSFKIWLQTKSGEPIMIDEEKDNTGAPAIKWNGSKYELCELVLALYDSKKLIASTTEKPLNQSEIANFINSIIELEIDGKPSKIKSSADLTDTFKKGIDTFKRSEDEKYFMSELLANIERRENKINSSKEK